MSDERSAISGQNQRWFDARGDKTRALNWPGINSHSVVWEIGGYEGGWAAQIADKLDPTIHIFEPQDWAVKKLTQRFLENPKIHIHPFGLWLTNDTLPLYNFETDGASLINPGARSGVCNFRDVYEVVTEHRPVDLCLMNIEGAEFLLIPYMIGMGMMKKFNYFWCQFHRVVKYPDERMNEIYKAMLRKHDKMWDYYPTAVAWERK